MLTQFSPVFAATITVTNSANSGPGTLRAALTNVVNGDTIDATGISGTILLTSGQLLLTNSVTILGPGPRDLALNGNAAGRVFYVAPGLNVTIAGLTITNGFVSDGGIGGGICNDHATLTVSNCTVTGNSAPAGGGGGGICNFGAELQDQEGGATLVVISSTISSNSATLGGGIFSSGGSDTAMVSSTINGNMAFDGGGIYNDSSLGNSMVTVTASTISSNSADENGGGICNLPAMGRATVTVTASTISGNSASGSGGGIWSGEVDVRTNTTISVSGSTFSNNEAESSGGSINILGGMLLFGDTILNASALSGNISNGLVTVISLGYNLSSDDGGGTLTNATDQINTDPMLGPLADIGGPTLTHALLPGSPAIDRGKSFGLTTDQRGAPRPFDFASLTNAIGGDGSDIGAFELGSPILSIQKLGTNAVLSWPAYYGDFNLQTSTDVILSNNWVGAGGSAFVVGNEYRQTNGPLSTNHFFRLRGN